MSEKIGWKLCGNGPKAYEKSEHQIRKALDRVHLDKYLTGIFCFQSLLLLHKFISVVILTNYIFTFPKQNWKVIHENNPSDHN